MSKCTRGSGGLCTWTNFLLNIMKSTVSCVPMKSRIQPTVPSPPQASTLKSGTSLKKFSLRTTNTVCSVDYCHNKLLLTLDFIVYVYALVNFMFSSLYEGEIYPTFSFFFLLKPILHWWKVTKYIYLSAVLRRSFKVFYLSISNFCYFILLLSYISG